MNCRRTIRNSVELGVSVSTHLQQPSRIQLWSTNKPDERQSDDRRARSHPSRPLLNCPACNGEWPVSRRSRSESKSPDIFLLEWIRCHWHQSYRRAAKPAHKRHANAASRNESRNMAFAIHCRSGASDRVDSLGPLCTPLPTNTDTQRHSRPEIPCATLCSLAFLPASF